MGMSTEWSSSTRVSMEWWRSRSSHERALCEDVARKACQSFLSLLTAAFSMARISRERAKSASSLAAVSCLEASCTRESNLIETAPGRMKSTVASQYMAAAWLRRFGCRKCRDARVLSSWE
eukprot:CAMPEP_0171215818 /NCGR_PEP_ID=MMETSP0790-20130122/31860_1 /TAXON_ID=2925 /ORGANISM="Alexandrium catenella, Strain OF101" /LENGTH=120 /DNA_ID=CAMNT_0011681577 /DNA_START=203 /DNA_END=562 /DNA_ORIENTATION=-